jgi:TetR/AcrR family transcriptional regulator
MSKDSRPKAYKSGRIRQDNEAQILRSAEQEFADKGFEGASINGIAKRAGIPRSNVHYYFNSKLDLYVAVLTGVIELWNEAFSKISPEDDPAEALGAYIHSKVMYSMSHPQASKIFASEVMHGAPNLSNYFKEEFRPWFKQKADVIQDWVDRGKMDPVDPYHLIFLIWSTTQHYADFDMQVCAALGKTRLSNADFEKASENLTCIVLKGCGIKVPA